MSVESVILGGGVVLLLWLHAVCFDPIHRATASWFPWVPVTETKVRLRPLNRVVAKVMAVAASVVYGIHVVAVVAQAVG